MAATVSLTLLALFSRNWYEHNGVTDQLNRRGATWESQWFTVNISGLEPLNQYVPRYIDGAEYQDCGDYDVDSFVALLQDCPWLWRLGLADESAEDRHFESLGHLCRLRKLDVTNASKMTGTGLKHLSAANPLVEVTATFTAFNDDGVRQLLRFPQLQDLDLGCTMITDDGLRLLTQLPNLECLSVSSPYLTNAGLEVLLDCPKLGVVRIESDPGAEVHDAVDEAAGQRLQERLDELRGWK